MENPTPSTVAEARRFISRINEERGFLSEDEFDRLGPPGSDTRRMVEDALLRKNELGARILTLAENLYMSSARFVFELLQNADDNNFSRAIARSEDPYVSFRIFPDRIVLECNEDGFTSKDLRAICAIGQSSKVGAQGYIGEKGIGFKSVFMAAWQVHIQSNAFSFTFTHHKGDSGIGMVSPVWREVEEVVDASLTRITLALHQDDDPAVQEQQYRIIIDQFDKLQGESLLFLRKLRRVQLSVHGGAGIPTSHVEYSLHGIDPVTVRKTSWLDDGPKGFEDKLYRITKHIAENVPASENRSYESEEHRADANTEIVLAFPLTKDLVPIPNKNQDVFAFLPIKKMGFKFLMHTDFVTEASRQDIVITSLRNQGLRRGIVDCFIKAVEEFCQHPTLQFQWMRWLPDRSVYPWDDFWQWPLGQIDTHVKASNVFRCQTDNRLKNISSLRILDNNHLDEAGTPLFRDLPSAIYLSQEYDNADLKILKRLGLESLSIYNIIDILSFDLCSDEGSSRLKSGEKDNDWHSRTARLILSCLKKGTEEQRQSIRSMEIIPLSTGEWSSITSAPLYYYHCEGGIEIPEGLDLRLVCPIATENPERRALFDELGVSMAPVRLIQEKILAKPRMVVRNSDARLQMAVSHLRYLYLSHDNKGAETARDSFIDYPVYRATRKLHNPQDDRSVLYLPTSGNYEPSNLLRDCGYMDFFIHDAYLVKVPATPPGKELSWVDWLCQHLNIRRHLRLTRWDTKDKRWKLSPELISVSANHVVGALQASWASQGSIFANNPNLVDETRDIMVLDRRGERIPLGETYLPLLELEESYSRFAEGEEFSFVQLTEPIAPGTYQEKWGFLVDVLKIGHSKDLQFYLRVLEVISPFGIVDVPIKRPERFLDLYITIQGCCEASDDRLKAWDMVRRRNQKRELIFIPAHNCFLDDMASPDSCVWAGNGDLLTVHPLEHLYRTEFGLDEADLESLRQYFRTVLEVPDCGSKHYINEIRKLQEFDVIEFDWINDIYHFINETRKGMLDSELDTLKKAFATERLIYAGTNGSDRWHTVSQCIWPSAKQIQDRVPLDEIYSDLEEFFVDFLGVATTTLEMIYGQLLFMGRSNPAPPIQEVKATIFEFNSLLQTSSVLRRPDHQRLFSSKILPVQYPTADGQYNVKLVDWWTEFAIVDREVLRRAFAPQVKLLDFTLDIRANGSHKAKRSAQKRKGHHVNRI